MGIMLLIIVLAIPICLLWWLLFFYDNGLADFPVSTGFVTKLPSLR